MLDTIKNAQSPFHFGIIKPCIYLPENVCENPYVTEQALLHEYTHYRHLDHIWSLVRIACLCVYWFNPLVWIAVHLSREDCELFCDESVIKRFGDNMRAEYGRMLLSMVTAKRHNKTAVCAITMAAGRLKRRISMIAESRKTSAYAFISVIVILAAVSGCTFTGANKPARDFDLTEWLGCDIQNSAAELTVTDTGYNETKMIKTIMPISAEYQIEYAYGAKAAKKELGFFEAGQPVVLTVPAIAGTQEDEFGQFRILPLTDGAAAYYGALDLTLSDNPSYSVLCIELPEGNYTEAYITEKSPREMVREHEINGETVKAERFFTTTGHVFFDNKLIITAVPGEQIGIGIRSETRVYEGFLPKDSKRGGQYEIKLKYVDLVFDENNVLMGYDDNNKTATVTVNEIPFDEYKTVWNVAVS